VALEPKIKKFMDGSNNRVDCGSIFHEIIQVDQFKDDVACCGTSGEDDVDGKQYCLIFANTVVHYTVSHFMSL
jgi:hypothetical protein